MATRSSRVPDEKLPAKRKSRRLPVEEVKACKARKATSKGKPVPAREISDDEKAQLKLEPLHTSIERNLQSHASSEAFRSKANIVTLQAPDQELCSEDEYRALEERAFSQWTSLPVKSEEIDDDEEEDDVSTSKKRHEGDEGEEGDEQEVYSSDDELTAAMRASVKGIQEKFLQNYRNDLERCVAENYCAAVTQVRSWEDNKMKLFANLPFKDFGTSKTGSNEKESGKTNVINIPKSKPLPVSIHYVTVSNSLMQEDDKLLKFLPYFGEHDNIKLDFDDYESDEEESDVEAVVDDDALLAAAEHYGTSERALESLSEVLKYSLDIIKKRLRELTFYHERRALEQRQMLRYFDFDFEHPDKMTYAYQKLFCRRCLIYGCRYHGSFQPRPCSGKEDRRFFVDSSLLQALKTFQEDASVVTPSFPLVIGNKQQKQDRVIEFCKGAWIPQDPSQGVPDCACPRAPHDSSEEDVWTPPQSAMFRKLFFVFGPQFCSIARVLGSKRCEQVRAYAATFPFLFVHRSLAKAPCDEEKKKKGTRTPKVPPKLPAQHSACDHLGPCNSGCSCVRGGMFCETYCPCDSTCRHRFSGCVCKTFCRTRACPCFAASRECTPGVCKGCIISSDKSASTDSKACCNSSLQTRNFKPLLFGESTVHGWGAFIAADALKSELITEYVGEIITQEEADRRGRIYDKLNRSYLFNLNEQYVIDAARKGNKIKFANHSQTPNCFSRVMMVNGDHRIGIYAKRKIRKGEELFFDYQHEHAGPAPEWFEKHGPRKEQSVGSSTRKS